MVGYLIDNNDFYLGKPLPYQLKRALANIAAPGPEIQLFNYLLGSTFILENSLTNNSSSYFDTRSGQVLLLGYPPRVQIILSLLFYQYDIQSLNYISTLDQLELISSSIRRPSEILASISSCSLVHYNRNVLKYLESLSSVVLNSDELNELSFLLNMQTSFNLEVLPTLEDKIQEVFRIFNQINSYNNLFIEIVKENNKPRAAILLGEFLNYDRNTLKSLSSVFEIWQSSQNI